MCMEFYMYLLWASDLGKDSAMYFLPIGFIKGCINADGEGICETQRDEMRKVLGLRASRNPIKPVAGIVHWANHYFVVVMDIAHGAAYMYGKDICGQDRKSDLFKRKFNEWNGTRLWEWTIDLFG